MDPLSIAATLGIIAAALVALGVIARALINVYKFFRSLDDASNIISEFPAWQTKVNLAMKELHPNSGSSLKDQVTAITEKLCENHDRIMETDAKVDSLGENVDTLGTSLGEIRQEILNHMADDQLHTQ